MATTESSPDIPEKAWTNPFSDGTPLHDLFERRISQHRDLVILIDDMNAERGTGKTVASLQLGNGMDQTDEGLTWSKVSMEPEEIRNAYAEEPPRSGLVLDEGEVGASNRQSMSKVNQALREIMSMGRVEEKYVVVNAPAIEFVDKDLRKLADIWIGMTRKGAGVVHRLDRQPYAGKLLTPKIQHIEFDDIPTDHQLREVYKKLTRAKRAKIRGDDGDGFVEEDDHLEAVKQAREEAAERKRNEMIYKFYTHPEVQAAGISQRIVAECAGVSQKTVSNVKNRWEDDK